MIPKKLLVVVMATFLMIRTTVAVPAPSESPKPVVGEPAPKIACEKFLNAPAGVDASWKALRGKVVVMVFWATWCGPCVSSIPAMNKLEAAHENDPIVFIHITDEEESVVTKFLKKNPIRGWVGIDVEGVTFKNYGVGGRPRAAIVGKYGTFLGWNDPRILAIEPETLQDVLVKGSSERLSNTQPSSVDPLEGIVRDTPTGKSGRNLCDIVIRRSDESSAKLQGGGDSRGLWHYDRPLISHLATFCDISSTQIVAAVELPKDHYDVFVLAENLYTPAMQEAVCNLLGAMFDLSFVREKRVMDVYILKTLPGREPTLTPSWGGVYNDFEMKLSAPSREILERMKSGENFFFGLTILEWLPKTLALKVNKPVILQLGDLPDKADEVYSFCFPYPLGDVESFLKAFEKNVGLTLEPARRTVEVLVVGPPGQSVLHSDN